MYDNRTRIILILLTITLIFSVFTIYIYSAGGLSLSARSAVLYEPCTKQIVYSKNPNKRLAMASTTKIMSVVVALENCDDIDAPFAVNDAAVGVEGSSIYIQKGEVFTMRALLYAMMLRSANDAASAIAYRVAGGIEDFAVLMNKKAKELGLFDTSFANPHGLDAEGHYTTAHDLAVITAYALENDTFSEIVSTYKKDITSDRRTITVVNHNKLLNLYDGAVGVKTGYTKKSGRSLVGAANRDGITLISVTIDAPDDWNDHRSMLDYGFSMLENRRICDAGEYSYRIPSTVAGIYLDVSNTEELSAIVRKNAKLTTKVFLPRYVAGDVKVGDKIGHIVFYEGKREVARLDLCAQNDVKENKKGLFPNIIKG